MVFLHRYLHHRSLLWKVAQNHLTLPGKNEKFYHTINPSINHNPGLVSILNDVDSGFIFPQARDSLLGLVQT